MFCTNIIEIDEIIFSYINDEALYYFCQTNKYIFAVCKDIRLKKIKLLYPTIPISNRVNRRDLYYFGKDSYMKLANYIVEQCNRNEIISWLNSPEVKINISIESDDCSTVKFYLKDNIIPDQKSINIAAKKVTKI